MRMCVRIRIPDPLAQAQVDGRMPKKNLISAAPSVTPLFVGGPKRVIKVNLTNSQAV